MDVKNMSPELREKALSCKSSKELLELAKDEGVELTDEQLEAVSGGEGWICEDNECPMDEW